MKLLHWSLSDVGMKREHNEDSFLVDPDINLYAVADGMGGHLGGEHASSVAVETLRHELEDVDDMEAHARRLLLQDPKAGQFNLSRVAGFSTRPSLKALDQELMEAGRAGTVPISGDPAEAGASSDVPATAVALRSAARTAGRQIYDEGQDNPRYQGMGTTLTAALFDERRVYFAHVGDSRAFIYRDGCLDQVTDDHSWIAEQVRSGVMTEAEAKDSKFRHIITRSVGFERDVEIDMIGLAYEAGDCFLMCSDGMSNYVENDELENIMSSTYFSRVPKLLVDLANDRGGDDNITVVVVYAANVL